jgi:hypothetical protein
MQHSINFSSFPGGCCRLLNGFKNRSTLNRALQSVGRGLEPSGIDILTSFRDRDWGKTSGSVRDRDKKQLQDFSGSYIFPTKTILSIRNATNIYYTLFIMNSVQVCLDMMF